MGSISLSLLFILMSVLSQIQQWVPLHAGSCIFVTCPCLPRAYPDFLSQQYSQSASKYFPYPGLESVIPPRTRRPVRFSEQQYLETKLWAQVRLLPLGCHCFYARSVERLGNICMYTHTRLCEYACIYMYSVYVFIHIHIERGLYTYSHMYLYPC